MSVSHTLSICTSCATVRASGQSSGKSSGQLLLEQLTELAQNWELQDQFAIQAAACMFVCEKPCTFSFTAVGKYTYLFGNVQGSDSASAILDCARSYYLNPEGQLPYSSRPEPLKTTVLARIPPQPV